MKVSDAKRCNEILGYLVQSVNKMPVELSVLAAEMKLKEPTIRKHLEAMCEQHPAWYQWMYRESAILLYRHYRDSVNFFLQRGGYLKTINKTVK
ncbi:hypothetical protein [Taibaiella soli]|uniref:Uncharacterized protein n=1 Tax=Taibaiella soli TaxID=1649169 RepID=A0A2W2ACD7_9BACT|nr:hypothetical protein [Taibaiella soli]PZF73095.1 hypothetical protein DN068_09480 [Taibaiella soli]